MKFFSKSGGSLVIFYRFLLILVILIALIVLAVTIYALIIRENPSIRSNTGTAFIPEQGDHIFTGIGRLRLPLMDTRSGNSGAPPVTVVLSITFPYRPEDRAFSEELALRVRDFRTLTETYFSALNVDDLGTMDEEEVKSALLEKYNSILRLGNISVLYFSDFMVFD